ncbi:hypothetical protein PTT_11856 [Pyrenophora teres f. teres 0-1]|uniref:Uncharacterized protein n=1 Tax=Pyrenophora teres f. teres (strain 0-1) TaxID=861557 RepID=E3RSG7_PYRTT|nr:hypothetical protein PTT_11856 [Pyrenophora teres f. teres 0-1]
MTTASAVSISARSGSNDLCQNYKNCRLWGQNNCGVPNGGADCSHDNPTPEGYGHCYCA